MKILVAGGTGVVGSGIVQNLILRGHQIRVLSRKSEPIAQGSVEYVQGNVFDAVSLAKAMRDIDVLINAVQFKNAPFENPSRDLTYEKVDAEGTESLVRVARTCGVNHMIYISGAGVSEEKTEPWFKAKWRAEQAVKNSGMIWTIFRPSLIYGPGDHSLNRMIQMVRWSPIGFILGKGYKIQPVFIDDMATAVTKSVEISGAKNQIYMLGGPEALTMNQILETVCQVLHKKRLFLNIPKPVAGLLFSTAEKIPGVPLTRDSLDFLTMDVLIPNFEIQRVQNELQIRFKTLKEGLVTYV